MPELSLDGEQSAEILAILNAKIAKRWQDSKQPFFIDPKNCNIDIKNFGQFSLLIRPRESNKTNYRVEVLKFPHISYGAHGVIYESVGVLVPENQFKFKACSRIIKSIDKKFQTDRKIINEALYGHKNGMLKTKSPLFFNSHVFLIMRKVNGIELSEFINKFYHTLKPRDILCILSNILYAYEQDVIKVNINHRDLKIENMIIDGDSLVITFIDYGMITHKNGKVKHGFVGTKGYIAPETLEHNIFTEKSAMFALGWSMAIVCGDNSDEKLHTLDAKELLEAEKVRTFDGLFEGLSLPQLLKDEITIFIKNMVAIDPDKRLNFEEAKKACNSLFDVLKNCESQENALMLMC